MLCRVSHICKCNDMHGHYERQIQMFGHPCWRQGKCDQEWVREDIDGACCGLLLMLGLWILEYLLFILCPFLNVRNISC